jgi:hypothetical protein
VGTGKEPSDTWRTEPEVASASGGHLAPEAPTSPALFESIGDPIASRAAVSSPPSSSGRERTSKRPVRRRQIRRVKRTLRHVDPMSVLKLSLLYYSCFLVVWLVVVAILYAIANSFGLFDAIEKLADAFVLSWKKEITLFLVERWAFVIGLLLLAGASLLNLFLAFLYNVVADYTGGIEMTFVERDLDR